MSIISRIIETSLEKCKTLNIFPEILREMQKAKLIGMTYIGRW
jgi:hypothetical protein